MLYTPPGGEPVVVPPEDEAVLAKYRDSMPLVWEPQYCGAPVELSWFPLIEDEEAA